MKKVHLICNAHLDPCWLWEWEEGAAEAISTFRCAADLCESFDRFVFNHNEVILYKWVEEYEPALFQRIQRLVREGRWNIMGGWYVQPDCNMPAGESLVRQVLVGRTYFRDKFGAEPTTAINFDPFGHSRGLVQILKKTGYDSYVFCRPNNENISREDENFVWVGLDGSEVIGHRANEYYSSFRGRALEKIRTWIEKRTSEDVFTILWGVGNHGGGPSRKDLEEVEAFIDACSTHTVAHSTLEQYFADLRATDVTLKRHEQDLNPWAVGCYTSQVRIKQKHRLLENEMFATEKMASAAALNGLLSYPKQELDEALDDLLLTQFHDILPGSSIQPVEEASLRLLDHGLEVLARVKARCFFALASGQPRGKDESNPILVYNPHPFPVHTIIECEHQLADVDWDTDVWHVPLVHQDGKPVPSQLEKEACNINWNWRKRSVFLAELPPSQMARFDCTFELVEDRPVPDVAPTDGRFAFRSDRLHVVINAETGLMDTCEIDGVACLRPGALQALVVNDDANAWAAFTTEFRDVAGAFRLMTPEESGRFSGGDIDALPAVRVIEDGPVRTVIEASFIYEDSFLLLTYKLPKEGTIIELSLRVYWNGKSKMLKLSIPTVLEEGRYMGQVAYGTDQLPTTREAVSQKWCAVVSTSANQAVACINDGIYGSDMRDGEMRLSLLRSPAFSGHPVESRPDRPMVLKDRFTPRMDQGERTYRFWLTAGPEDELLETIDRLALVCNERPTALSFYPPGQGETPRPLAVLRDSVIQMPTAKQAESGNGYVVRLFNPTGQARRTDLVLPVLDAELEVALEPFEIKSLHIDPQDRAVREVDLLERPLS